MFLTHYYHKNDKPFQTLSALSEAEALTVIESLGGRTGKVYRRFKNPQTYLRSRKETEQWLKQCFIQKGGKPSVPYPQYLVLGRSIWIEEGFDNCSCALQIPLSVFSPEHISFTYPDSMISYWLRTHSDKTFYQPSYHAQVFTLKEIREIIADYGFPREVWRTDKTRQYDLFIEAQFWEPVPSAWLSFESSLPHAQ